MKYFKLWRKYKIRILYKSGNSQVIACDNFTISQKIGGREISWDNALPRPLFLNVDEVEAVYKL